jgi:hypothetical protein
MSRRLAYAGPKRQAAAATTTTVTSGLSDFKIIRCISGTPGVHPPVPFVYKTQSLRSGEMCALKVLPCTRDALPDMVSVVHRLANLQHPNLVHYRAYFVGAPEERPLGLCIISDYSGGGDLAHLIRAAQQSGRFIEEPVVWRIALQLLDASAYLHKVRMEAKARAIMRLDWNALASPGSRRRVARAQLRIGLVVTRSLLPHTCACCLLAAWRTARRPSAVRLPPERTLDRCQNRPHHQREGASGAQRRATGTSCRAGAHAVHTTTPGGRVLA